MKKIKLFMLIAYITPLGSGIIIHHTESNVNDESINNIGLVTTSRTELPNFI